MSKLLVLQITMLLLILVGALIKRIGIISKEGQKNINDLVIYLVLPCNIVKSFMIDCDSNTFVQFAEVLVISIGIQIVSVILGKILYGKREVGHRMSLQYGVICSNAGFLGNPVAGGRFWIDRACYGIHIPDSHAHYDVVVRYRDLYAVKGLESDFEKGCDASLYYCLFYRFDPDSDTI